MGEDFLQVSDVIIFCKILWSAQDFVALYALYFCELLPHSLTDIGGFSRHCL